MKITIIGFPRIGNQRELKFASEKYFSIKSQFSFSNSRKGQF